MNKFLMLGCLFGLILFSMSANNAFAVCCFPYDMTHYIDPNTGHLVVVGELWNDSYKREPFGNAKYEFVFSNSTGDTLFTKDILITDGHPLQNGFVTNPYGGPFPFQIAIEDIDPDILKQVAHVSTGRTSVDYFEWKPPDLKSKLYDVKKIATIQGKTSDDIFTKWQVTGTITNTHSDKTENAYVLASLYGTENNVVGVAGYSDEDIHPFVLEGNETKWFAIHAIIPQGKTVEDARLYAESDDSFMLYEHTKPLILKPAEGRIKRGDVGTPITISANVTNISREPIDFDWIIQIKKSPKSLAGGDVTNYPESKVDSIKTISDSISALQSKIIQYSWTPENGGIYFYEMFLWDKETPVSLPFKGTFLWDNQILVSSNSLKEQFKSGISINEIQCREPLFLVTKSDGSPACVKHETKAELISRGWMKTQVNVHDDSAFIDSTKNLEAVQIFLSLHPDAIAKVDHENFMVIYEQSGMREHPTGSIIQHTKRLYANLDYEGKPAALYMECGGPITSSSPVTDFLDDPDWCFPADQTPFYPSGNSGDTITDNSDTIDLAKLVDANNQFAIKFYSQIAQDSNENIFFSPTSISTAFSILYEGARENTADEMQNVFGFPEDEQERRLGYASLHRIINDKNNDNESVRLHIANALWLAENFEPLQEYTNTAMTYYDTTVTSVDFVSDDGVNKINNWVKSKTEEKIEKLLEPGSTGSTTRMAITNAIYFKGLWEHPFVPEDTYEADFVVSPEKTVKVQMMTYPHKMQVNVAFTEQMRMLELPYKNNTMSMLILLPSEIDGLKSVEDSLTLENLASWKSMLSKIGSGTVIHLPKFSLETDYNLIETLPDMGMPSVFSPSDADLSGITGSKRLYVSQAIHKAFVDVNEEGTEAAGATAIVLDESSGLLFKVDHPFIFIIQDKQTDSILFIGKIVDPTM